MHKIFIETIDMSNASADADRRVIHDVVLISIEPEKLIDLKRRIQEETPGARVTIGTKADDLIGSCDLIVTSTSAFGQRILDITGQLVVIFD